MALFANTASVTRANSQGMGQAIARTLAGRGAHAAVHWYRSGEAAEALSRELTIFGRRAPVIGAGLGDATTARVVLRQVPYGVYRLREQPPLGQCRHRA